MAGRIPQAFIDDLLTRVDIVDVIDARVPLKKQGANQVACCPFHDEKTPSFSVSPTKQFYYCFGCGASGTALGFVMEYERIGFVEAVETLAESIGVEIPREGGGGARDGEIERDYALLAEAERFYRQQLRANPQAIAYFKERGVSGETAARFGLGFAPAGWQHLIEHLGERGRDDLLRSGLVNQHEESGRLYDRFRGRVMFPIRDRRGRAIAFGGRVLDDGSPKYLNSPETSLFHKGRELYGLYEARRARSSPPRLLVVEGYMDVVMLAEHGIDYAVATLGTSMSERHVEHLFSVVGEAVFCFDGDEAGRQAAWRALSNTLPALSDGRESRFLFLPDGEDPDSLVRREGREAFEQRLEHARPLADFLIDRLKHDVDTTSMGGRARLAAEAGPLLTRMPAGVYHDLLVERLATEVGLPPDRLRADLTGKGTQAPSAARPVTPRRRRGSTVRMTPMRTAIALLLQQPSLAGRLPADHPALAGDQPGSAVLADLHGRATADPAITTARLLEGWRDTSEQVYLERLAAYPFATDADAERDAGLVREFDDTVARLTEQGQRARRSALLDAARERALSDAEKRELLRLMGHSTGC
ncbi:MAG: DNA primase [Halofilum sp. (in: g-proteobacteria)]